jgi:hypothetical protein
VLSPAKKINSLVLGLDNSGKTTTLYGLRLEQVTKQVGGESALVAAARAPSACRFSPPPAATQNLHAASVKPYTSPRHTMPLSHARLECSLTLAPFSHGCCTPLLHSLALAPPPRPPV